jgi:hypothetical protein
MVMQDRRMAELENMKIDWVSALTSTEAETSKMEPIRPFGQSLGPA